VEAAAEAGIAAATCDGTGGGNTGQVNCVMSNPPSSADGCTIDALNGQELPTSLDDQRIQALASLISPYADAMNNPATYGEWFGASLLGGIAYAAPELYAAGVELGQTALSYIRAVAAYSPIIVQFANDLATGYAKYDSPGMGTPSNPVQWLGWVWNWID